jgi:hypothetical protein
MTTTTYLNKLKKLRVGKDSGQVLVITALCLVVLLGFLGLATDVGYLRFMKQESQKAADAAAMAGAMEIVNGGDPTTAAQYDAALNGFTHGTDGVSIAVNNPPLSGPNTGESAYVEVIVQDNVPTLFMKVLGRNSGGVAARAVAALTSGPNCIYSLDPGDGTLPPGGGKYKEETGFKMSPGAKDGIGYEMDVDCGIVVNSNVPESGKKPAVDLGDNILVPTSFGIRDPGGCVGCGDMDYYHFADLVADPLAYLPTPVPTGSCLDDPMITEPDPEGDVIFLPPGNYCNGITIGNAIDGTLQPDVQMSGTYYITGGEFFVDTPKTENEDDTRNHHVNLFGDEVFIYIASNATIKMGGGNGKFNNSYGGLNAPTSGTYAGILMFQDRATPYYKADISSGHGDGFSGALYFPGCKLSLRNSNPNNAQYVIMVAWQLEFYRDMVTVGSIGADYSSLVNGSPIHSVALVE